MRVDPRELVVADSAFHDEELRPSSIWSARR
jgi:hypothetical protein